MALPFLSCKKRRLIDGSDGETGTDFATVNQVGANWTTWAPTFGANGAMTWGSITTEYAKYRRTGSRVEFIMRAFGTVGGTPNTDLTFTLPVTAASAVGGAFAAWILDGGNSLAGNALTTSTTVCTVRRYDGANWSAGASRLIAVSGFYEV